MKLVFATALFMALDPAGLYAWGDKGHQIVGEIAWHQLTPRARREVRDLLPSGEYGTLYAAATWPDRYARSNPSYAWVDPLHYINVSIQEKTVRVTEQNCKNRECVIRAIERFSWQLRDPEAPEWMRVNALRFLAHFVGDIHQPLHVAHRDNCGGCSVKPRFGNSNKRTIHKIWDTTLIEEYLESYALEEEDEGRSAHFDTDLWEELAYDLQSSITPDERKRWIESLNPTDWAQESLEVAQYDIFRYASSDMLPDDYPTTAHPVVMERLKQGGVRLAGLLNVIFSRQELPFDKPSS